MTSEPVGNGPRSGTPSAAIPGNSHRDRAAAAENAVEPRQPLEKIVTGDVITRKPSWWKRAARSMIAEDVQNVNDYVLSDIIVPAIKNLIRDIIVGGTDRTLYGTSRNSIGIPSRAGLSGIGLGRVDTRGVIKIDGRAADPVRQLSDIARARHSFNEIVLDSYEEGVEVVRILIDTIQRYRSVAVADLYDVLGVTSGPQDRGWGWTDLSTAAVRQTRGGFLLDLPQPEPLR